MYNDATATIYVAMGFASAPENKEDLEAAGKKSSAELQEFADFFLQKKFVGGDKLSIADFKIAPFFAAYAHPRVTEMCKMEVPARIVTFNQDFLEACPSAKALYEAEDGHSVCQFLDSKTEAEKGDASATAEDEELQKAMELEANKPVVDLKDSGPTAENSPEVAAAEIEEKSAPKGGCLC
jgi:glutathione S-transferase